MALKFPVEGWTPKRDDVVRVTMRDGITKRLARVVSVDGDRISAKSESKGVAEKVNHIYPGEGIFHAIFLAMNVEEVNGDDWPKTVNPMPWA